MLPIGHILGAQQFSRDFIENLFRLTDEMRLFDKPTPTAEEHERVKQLRLPQEPRRRVLGCLFYEPSTRTRFSFEAAMRAIGGDVLSTESAGMFSSAAKGESLADTIKVVGNYYDAIVLRHPKEGAALEAAQYSTVPVINAGDGAGQHPTQALLDLYTINRELGRMDDLKVGVVGDLKYGRTVHSLAYLLANMSGIKFYFVAPELVRMRPDILEYLKERNVQFEEIEDLVRVASMVDVLYVTRI